MYIDVLTQIGAKAVDQTFTYSVPLSLRDKIKVGVRVKIPFGKMIIEGFVMDVDVKVKIGIDKIKEIIENENKGKNL